MILNTSKKLIYILDNKEKINLLAIFFLTFFTMLLEMIGLAIIIPFITIVLDYKNIDSLTNFMNLDFINNLNPIELMNGGILILLFFFLKYFYFFLCLVSK